MGRGQYTVRMVPGAPFLHDTGAPDIAEEYDALTFPLTTPTIIYLTSHWSRQNLEMAQVSMAYAPDPFSACSDAIHPVLWS